MPNGPTPREARRPLADLLCHRPGASRQPLTWREPCREPGPLTAALPPSRPAEIDRVRAGQTACGGTGSATEQGPFNRMPDHGAANGTGAGANPGTRCRAITRARPAAAQRQHGSRD